MIPGGPGWKCPRRVGFLFPHPCERTTPLGCPDCNNGSVQDPYRNRTDRYGYGDGGDYDSDGLSWDTANAVAFGGGLSGGGGASLDFTEADGASLVNPDESFEDDLSAS